MHGNWLSLKLAAHSGTPPGHSARSRCSQRRLRFDVIHRAMSCCAPHLMTPSEALGSGNYAISLFAAVHEPGSGTEEASSPAGKGSAYSGSAEGGARCAEPLPMPRSQLGAYLINRRSDPLECSPQNRTDPSRIDRLDRRTTRSRLVLTESLFARDPWLLSEAPGHAASTGVFERRALVELPIIPSVRSGHRRPFAGGAAPAVRHCRRAPFRG